MLFSALSIIYGAASSQVDSFKEEFRELREKLMGELRGIRVTLEEMLKTLKSAR